MATSRYARDRGLTVRMILVMVYLALVFGAAVAALVVAIGGWGVWLSLFAVLVLVISWFGSRHVSLRAMGARVVTPDDQPVLHGALDRLCALSGLPKPKLAVMKAWDPNAFALGRSPKYAVIVVTEPLLELLDQDELEAVLAHELAHVAHRDLLVMTVASSPGILNSMTGSALREGGLGRGWGPVVLAWMFTGVVHLLCFLPLRLLSRYRELCSDLSAAQLTQRPGSLASALQKISGGTTPIPSTDLRSQAVVDVFGIVPAAGRSARGLTATHPTLERRMDQLARISAALGKPSP
jgi:heat shock protein HtpX